jgi:small-conductance mechanosensitive channel
LFSGPAPWSRKEHSWACLARVWQLRYASRVAIFAGKMYSVGDRVQLETMSGDLIDVGFFYTRMMEIGNWIGGDQASGRIVQLPNSKVFGNQIFNYTQNFDYIWD